MLKSVEQLWKTGLEPRRAPDDGEDDDGEDDDEVDEDELDDGSGEDEDEDEDEDEEEEEVVKPRPSMQVLRSFTGSYTVGISWEARTSFADALKRGGLWNTLSIATGDGPAVISPTADGYRLTISPSDAAALEAAVRVGDPWRSPEGETCVEVWGRPR